MPHVPGLLALRDGTLFVPTQPPPKPAPRPSVAKTGMDLAWLYAHRFDSGSDDRRGPGIPVRSQVGSPFDIDSGAFHGVRAVNGWSAVRVAVSIPCGARHFQTGPGYNEATREQGIVDQETGYIYIGGWGAGPRGVSVDAGLQKSSAQSLHDDYAFYWKFASNKPITSEDRFPCGGPDVVLELYPVSPTLLVFSVTGIFAGRPTPYVHGRAAYAAGGRLGTGRPVRATTGSSSSASSRSLSRGAVGTCRKSGVSRTDRFSSGSYFGVAGPHDLTPRIVWSHCEIGHVVPGAIAPQYTSWSSSQTWTSPVPGIYTDWPPLGVFRGREGACDAAGIYLRA